MVEVYTENGRIVEENCAMSQECKKTRTMRLAAVSLGTALLLSMIGAYNLNSDVNDLTKNKVGYIENRVSDIETKM
ncbi:MAG TPA: hypothetical protein V6C89_16530 [Drouetiella sp.]|jgi:hypothetical protein